MIRKMTLEDTKQPLHERNVDEIMTAFGLQGMVDPAVVCTQYLVTMYNETTDAYVYEHDGRVYSFMGVESNEEYRGTMYMLFADIDYLPLSFYKDVTKLKKQMVEKYGKLTTTVMNKNTYAVKLARFWKAKVLSTELINGEQYTRIEVN